jgi:hypothetical protein
VSLRRTASRTAWGEAGPRQDHPEFFAPITTGDIEFPDAVFEENRHAHQHRITELMAVDIVEALEVIQIQHDDAGGQSGAPGALHFLI